MIFTVEHSCACGHVWKDTNTGEPTCPECHSGLTGRWVKRNNQPHFELSITSRVVGVAE